MNVQNCSILNLLRPDRAFIDLGFSATRSPIKLGLVLKVEGFFFSLAWCFHAIMHTVTATCSSIIRFCVTRASIRHVFHEYGTSLPRVSAFSFSSLPRSVAVSRAYPSRRLNYPERIRNTSMWENEEHVLGGASGSPSGAGVVFFADLPFVVMVSRGGGGGGCTACFRSRSWRRLCLRSSMRCRAQCAPRC
jgi:hypothetical protein